MIRARGPGDKWVALTPDPRHRSLTLRLLSETVLVFVGLALLTLWLDELERLRWALPLPIVAQGLWLHRLYVVAHEASHGKLWPATRRINDLLGQLLLMPLLVPLRIHRKIHAFHHGHNRRDHDTSALDTFVVEGRCGPLRRAWFYLLWYLGVFAGGYFVHSLVSVVLFLVLPLRLARRVSPAFKGWKRRDQLASIAVFALALALHLALGFGLGARAWVLTIGLPLLVFAWCYSLLVYIYHYDTDYGPAVKYHVRSLRPHPLTRWWLLGFSDHAVHHRDPSLPWYALAEHRQPLPPEHAANQKIETLGAAILWQLRGPIIVEREPGRSA